MRKEEVEVKDEDIFSWQNRAEAVNRAVSRDCFCLVRFFCFPPPSFPKLQVYLLGKASVTLLLILSIAEMQLYVLSASWYETHGPPAGPQQATLRAV